MARIFTLKNGFSVLLGVLAIWCSYTFFYNRAYVELQIEVTEKTPVKIYWKSATGNFSEKNRVYLKAKPGKKTYRFFLTDLDNIEILRFDPIQYAGKVTVKSLIMSQAGYEDVVFDAEYDFSGVEINRQLKVTGRDSTGIEIESTGVDPYFIFSPQFNYKGLSPDEICWVVVCFIFLVLCCFAIVHSTFHLGKDFQFVPLFLSAALLGIVLMSSVSKYNSHPDEHVHWSAIDYYQENWLPPVYDDEKVRHTYSGYGVSRLNSGEIYYDLAGKFKRIISVFKLPDHIATRLFNNLLFAIIVLVAFRSYYGRLLAIPLLISPQVWYLFSYANSDAFAVFITYCCGLQLVSQDSALNRFIARKGKTTVFSLLFIGMLLGSMFLLKKNYYLFIGFFYFILLLHCLCRLDGVARKKALIRVALITCIAGMLFGVRTGLDYKVNGFDKKEKLSQLREIYADTMYRKASAATGEQHLHLYMKERGVPLEDVIVKDRWFEKSFRSSFGQYGYMSISAQENYYKAMKVLGCIAVFFFFGAILIRGGTFDRLTAVTALTFSVTLIGISLMHSWTDDFQAQGRYLFPIVGMLGVSLATAYKVLNKSILTLLLGLMFFMSLYSYLFVAIYHIAKVQV